MFLSNIRKPFSKMKMLVFVCLIVFLDTMMVGVGTGLYLIYYANTAFST